MPEGSAAVLPNSFNGDNKEKSVLEKQKEGMEGRGGER